MANTAGNGIKADAVHGLSPRGLDEKRRRHGRHGGTVTRSTGSNVSPQPYPHAWHRPRPSPECVGRRLSQPPINASRPPIAEVLAGRQENTAKDSAVPFIDREASFVQRQGKWCSSRELGPPSMLHFIATGLRRRSKCRMTAKTSSTSARQAGHRVHFGRSATKQALPHRLLAAMFSAQVHHVHHRRSWLAGARRTRFGREMRARMFALPQTEASEMTPSPCCHSQMRIPIRIATTVPI